MSQTRIYLVGRAGETDQKAGRLIEATSQAQAINHVTRGKFVAAVATTLQVVSLMTAGVNVEKAGAEEVPT